MNMTYAVTGSDLALRPPLSSDHCHKPGTGPVHAGYLAQVVMFWLQHLQKVISAHAGQAAGAWPELAAAVASMLTVLPPCQYALPVLTPWGHMTLRWTIQPIPCSCACSADCARHNKSGTGLIDCLQGSPGLSRWLSRHLSCLQLLELAELDAGPAPQNPATCAHAPAAWWTS